ncbi:Translation elongation factor LepA, partial [uncultured Gammaproteobacteria bacterium]
MVVMFLANANYLTNRKKAKSVCVALVGWTFRKRHFWQCCILI